ncbi:MAG: alanine racemase [Clostridia bacterium]|nr:alanine racemase [Clostridia bacterium]
MDFHRIYAKIDLGAIAHNIKLIKEKIGESKLMMIVKADAYGHGALAVAKAFEKEADYLAVAEMGEAMELRAGGVHTPILILGYTSPSLYELALEHDITLTLFTLEGAKALSDLCVRIGKTARVHFAVDTGMGRIGWQVCERSADEAAEAFRLPGICAEGIFSHFATADCEDASFAEEQRAQFELFLKMLKTRGVCIPIKHMNNSAGIVKFREQYDMVRAGILLYGLYPSENVKGAAGEGFALRPAMELITHIAHIKELEAGKPISYGSTYVTERKTRVATLPVGYADGYPRSLSGRGEVLVRGVRCPILGRVCMDQMMIDVSAVPEAKVEEKAVLVGRDGAEFISAEEVAALAGTINYELICGVAKRVPRIY